METLISGRWLLLGALIAGLAGCAHGGEQTGVYLDDSWITLKVKSDMVSDKNVHARDISVNTTKGVVTLSGAAGSWDEANKAAEIARRVPGVKEVENNIRIQPNSKEGVERI